MLEIESVNSLGRKAIKRTWDGLRQIYNFMKDIILVFANSFIQKSIVKINQNHSKQKREWNNIVFCIRNNISILFAVWSV